MNTKRNNRCPCGSGKKYKQCHGRSGGSKQQLSGHQYVGHVRTGATAQLGATFFPGEQGRLSAVPDHLKTAGTPGPYRVIFILSRPEQGSGDENQFDLSIGERGDSHLAMAPPAFSHPALPDISAVNFESGTAEFSLKFTGQPNANGFLGRIESAPFEALGFEDAESKAYHLMVKILSSLSSELDIPLYIHRIYVIEETTSARSVRLTFGAGEAPLSLQPPPKLGSEFSHYASLYREALTSNSVVYRFLCLFKIIEGVRSRRNRILREKLEKGEKPLKRVEKFPNDAQEYTAWLRCIYAREMQGRALSQIFRPEVVGKKLNNVIDTHLVPLRNTVAHAILDSGELGMSSDDLFKLEKIIYWLPATRVIVRRMLRNEFPEEFLLYLPSTGDVGE